MNIKFSVIIPVYNRHELINQTIDSVLSQTYSNFELLVINDGSTDHTQKVLETYGNTIKILTQSNQGPEAARHKGIAEAQGDYLVFLDSDDLLVPIALETYHSIIGKFDKPPLILGAMNRINSDHIKELPNEVHSTVTVYRFNDYLSKNIETGISNSMIVINKAVFNDLFKDLPPEKSFPFDDIHFVLQCGTLQPCIVVDQPHTIIYRIHDGNTVKNVDFMSKGALLLTRSEWRGRYPGGAKRRWERWARIGGITYSMVRSAQLRHRYYIATVILIYSFPMIFAATIRKIQRRWEKHAPITFELKNTQL